MLSRILRNFFQQKPHTVFRFKPRWKEELLVVGFGGAFVLNLTMGVLTAYLPNEKDWQNNGPIWARELWPTLKGELEQWCKKNNAKLCIEEDKNLVREE